MRGGLSSASAHRRHLQLKRSGLCASFWANKITSFLASIEITFVSHSYHKHSNIAIFSSKRLGCQIDPVRVICSQEQYQKVAYSNMKYPVTVEN